MGIQWINGKYEEDQRVFDSVYEAWEWSDGLHPDISSYLSQKLKVGYASPDVKVIDHLSNLIPNWADDLQVKVNIHCGKKIIDNKTIYEIWVSPADC